MARKGNGKKTKNNFKEFSFDGKEIKYSGRVYPDLKNSTAKCDITPCNVTLNGVITIKGCKLMQTDDNTWISWPQYQDKNKEYQSYIYVEKNFSKDEIDKLAKEIEKVID